MLNPSFTKRTLRYQLRYRDFVNASPALKGATLEAVIEDALEVVAKGFDNQNSIRKHKLHGKNIFRLTNLSEELVARKVSSNIGNLTGVSQSDRNTIISDLRVLLEENVRYRIYKLDIKSFYETVNVASLLDRLKKDTGITRPTVFLIRSLFQSLNAQGVVGLPRGLSISATLSELVMKKFDFDIKSRRDVFHFNRFVDDIVIITSGKETPAAFVSELEAIMPDGLCLNESKTQINLIEYQKKLPGDERCRFDYLGYEFVVRNPNEKCKKRYVNIDIAEKKARKIKTRLVKSAIDLIKNNDVSLFVKRVKFLTSNHTIFDPETSVLRLAGIFYNYRHISDSNSGRLLDLDVFLRTLILAQNTKISKKLSQLLTKQQKRKILKMTFSRGFKSRIIYSYSTSEIDKIIGGWKYE